MKLLVTNRRVLTWLCMCPAAQSTSTKSRLLYAASAFIASAIMFLSVMSSYVFFINTVFIDFEESLYAAFQVAANWAILTGNMFGFIYRHQIAAILEQLSEIYVANQNAALHNILIDANNKSEWLWKVFVKFVMGGFFMNTVSLTLTSMIYCYFAYGKFDVSHLYHPYKLSFPWDQRTVFGYLGEVAYGIASTETYFACNGSILFLFITICWHHQAFHKRIQYSMYKLNESKSKRSANDIICEVIRFHVQIKDWFLESAKVYSPFVLVLLICNMLFLAMTVFQIDLQLRHIDLSFVLLLTAFLTGISNLFVYCYFGKLASESYVEMAECLYESNWHELSLDLQKKILLTILNMQGPVSYHGFGVAILNLETFLKFIRGVYTYYMMFKTLTVD